MHKDMEAVLSKTGKEAHALTLWQGEKERPTHQVKAIGQDFHECELKQLSFCN